MKEKREAKREEKEHTQTGETDERKKTQNVDQKVIEGGRKERIKYKT